MLSLEPILEDPTDCETCGMTWDSCEVNYIGKGMWSIQVTAGCTGGFTEEGTRQEIINKVENERDYLERLFTKESIDETIRDLELA